MLSPRMIGLLLMAIAALTFRGTTMDVLPAEAFFPALGLFALGAIKFIRSNREAMKAGEKEIERKLNPVIRENQYAQALAERQAARRGAMTSQLNAEEPAANESHTGAQMSIPQPNPEPTWSIELHHSVGEFVVDTDVSFPVEVQRVDALADQLGKLKRLLEQGVLTEEEYAVAKAKMLG